MHLSRIYIFCIFRGFTFSVVLLFHKAAACVDDAIKVVLHYNTKFGLLGSTYQLNLKQEIGNKCNVNVSFYLFSF
jgi:hypothetical protein